MDEGGTVSVGAATCTASPSRWPSSPVSHRFPPTDRHLPPPRPLVKQPLPPLLHWCVRCSWLLLRPVGPTPAPAVASDWARHAAPPPGSSRWRPPPRPPPPRIRRSGRASGPPTAASHPAPALTARPPPPRSSTRSSAGRCCPAASAAVVTAGAPPCGRWCPAVAVATTLSCWARAACSRAALRAWTWRRRARRRRPSTWRRRACRRGWASSVPTFLSSRVWRGGMTSSMYVTGEARRAGGGGSGRAGGGGRGLAGWRVMVLALWRRRGWAGQRRVGRGRVEEGMDGCGSNTVEWEEVSPWAFCALCPWPGQG